MEPEGARKGYPYPLYQPIFDAGRWLKPRVRVGCVGCLPTCWIGCMMPALGLVALFVAVASRL